MRDIEQLLIRAADDSDRPLNISMDDLLQRGRKSVRRRRFAVVATTTLAATSVAVGATPAISALRGVEPAAASQSAAAPGLDHVTVVKALPPPPVSPVKDADVLRRCLPGDKESLDFNKTHKVNTFDKAGPLTAKWTLALKSGVSDAFMAIFVSPDRSIAATCYSAGVKGGMAGTGIVDRTSTTYVVPKNNPHNRPMSQQSGIQVPENVARVLVDVPGEKIPREALMSKGGGFYTIGWPTSDESKPAVIVRVRGYDAKNQPVFDEKIAQQAQRIPPPGK
jgi:hypothetical protein